EAEQEADRVHVPALGDELEEPAEGLRHEAARDQLVREGVTIVLPAAHVAEDADDLQEDDEVEDADEDEEDARHGRPDRGADALETALGSAVTDDALHDGLRGESECERDEEDHGRMAEAEEEPDADGPPALLQQLARGVVDRGDVIGVERVAQPERVREPAQAHEGRVCRALRENEAPADRVQQHDDRSEPEEPEALAAVERVVHGACDVAHLYPRNLPLSDGYSAHRPPYRK